MKQSTRFIIGSVAFILLFSVVAFKLQDDSLLLNATTLHEKLVRTTNDFKGLSLVNHLLLILIILGGFFWKKGRNILFVLFMIQLSIGAFISAFKHNIPPIKSSWPRRYSWKLDLVINGLNTGTKCGDIFSITREKL